MDGILSVPGRRLRCGGALRREPCLAGNQVKRFRPSGVLDWTFEIVLIVKGLDGILEIIGGLLLLAVNPTLGVAFLTVFDVFMVWLTYREFGKHRRRQPAVA